MQTALRDRVLATQDAFKARVGNLEDQRNPLSEKHKRAGILAGYSDADDPPWAGEWDNSSR